MDKLIAKVERKFPIVSKTTKDGGEFKTQKIVIVWDEDSEYPSRMILEQGGDKKISVANELVEGKKYSFNLTYRVNYWKDSNNMETAFGSVSAWSVDQIEEENKTLPF